MVAIVARRLGAQYTVAWHNQKRCRIRLALVTDTAIPDKQPAIQIRAERSVAELIGPTARVTSVEWERDALAALEVSHEAGTKLAAAGYRHRIERVLSTMLPGRWRAVWDLENDTVRFEQRPAFASNIWMPVRHVDDTVDILTSYDDAWIPFGVDEDGNEMVWRPAHDPNVMLVGAPGTGKTVTAHTILVAVARYGWLVWVVDGKSIEFLGFRGWPNVQIVATNIEEQVAVIHRAWEVMEHRYALITSGRAKESDFEPLVVFLDEYADFRGNLLAWYAEIKVKGDPTRPLALSRVASIARKGRTSRVHLIFGTQRPDAEYFGGDTRDNFRMRISMGRLSPQGAMMMWESPIVGTSIPRACRGRATTINDHNRPVEIQTYRTPDPRKTAPGSDEADLLDRLRPECAQHERLLIVAPAVEPDLDTGEACGDPTYSDYANAKWVRASDHPDLDPVAQRAEPSISGRQLASPLTVFGLSSSPEPIFTLSKPPMSRIEVIHEEADPFDVEAEAYGPPTSVKPIRLEIGDLILVDEDLDQWAVVDSEPDDDLSDPDCITVTWRSDEDEEGALSLPADQPIPARHPITFDS
jgi:hypothetical protein